MEITIRLAEEKDISSIAAIEKDCFTTPESEASILDVIENPVYEAFVAECEGGVVGHTITMTTCGDMDILSVAVKPSCRRFGIGKKLMDNINND